MFRSLVVVIVAVAVAVAPCAASTPTPSAHPSSRATKHPGFANKIHSPHNGDLHVPAADCNRRSASVSQPGGQLGPNGASRSQTLIALPIGANAAAATREQRIAEACAHRR
jgi:hypothetical protein